MHASFLYMEATKKYYIEAAAIIARLQLCFLLYILHTQDISTTVPWCRLEEVSTRPNPTWNFFILLKWVSRGFDLILLSRVVYYCNYIFCNIVKHFTLINKIICENVSADFTFDPIRPLFNSPCVKHCTTLKHQRASQSHLILYQPFMVTEKVSIASHHRPLVL